MTKSLTLALLLTTLPATQGAVVYTEIGQRGELVLLGNHTIPIDFDDDGAAELDVIFKNSGADADVATTATTGIVAIPKTPPDVGAFVLNYSAGDSVGSILAPDSLEYYSGLYGGLRSCRNIGCIGLWGGGTNFMGVEFEKDGRTHYGYVEIDIPFDFGLAAGQVLAFAYETEPGVIDDAPCYPGSGRLQGYSRRRCVRCFRGRLLRCGCERRQHRRFHVSQQFRPRRRVCGLAARV